MYGTNDLDWIVCWDISGICFLVMSIVDRARDSTCHAGACDVDATLGTIQSTRRTDNRSNTNTTD